jgi:hypothetical protein
MARILGAAVMAAVMMCVSEARKLNYLIVGNDEKAALNDAKPVLSAPGKDTVSIVDIGLPACLIAMPEGGSMP